MRLLPWLGSAIVSCAAIACAHESHGVQMNRFIPDDKLAAVRICATTGQALVRDLGEPNGRGRDGDMGTLSWSSAAMVTDSQQAAFGTQMVLAWVDADGLVAGFVVNPASIPQKPLPCREQTPSSAPDVTPAAPSKPKHDARLRRSDAT